MFVLNGDELIGCIDFDVWVFCCVNGVSIGLVGSGNKWGWLSKVGVFLLVILEYY